MQSTKEEPKVQSISSNKEGQEVSVQTWNRLDSKMMYLSEVYKLGTELGDLFSRLPSKYRMGMGDEIQHMVLEAIYNGRMANSIYALGSKADLHERRYHLQAMAALVDTISTGVTIVLENYRHVDGMPTNKTAQFYEKEKRVAKICSTITKLIFGLIESDIKRWNSQHSGDRVPLHARMKATMGDIRFTKHSIQVHHVPRDDETSDSIYNEFIPKEELLDYDFSTVTLAKPIS